MANFNTSQSPYSNDVQSQQQHNDRVSQQQQQHPQEQNGGQQQQEQELRQGQVRKSASFTLSNRPRRSREPWWDDVEDLKRQEEHRRQQPWLQQRKSDPSRNPFDRRPANPFDESNPFNSSFSSSSSTFSGHRNNPFDQASFSSYKKQSENSILETPQSSFDSKVSTSSLSSGRNSATRTNSSFRISYMDHSQQRMLRESNSTSDSLDDFLDTSHNAPDDSTRQTSPAPWSRKHRNLEQSNTISTEQSFDTNVSEEAKSAAKALVEAFNRPRRSTADHSASNNSPTNCNTPKTVASSVESESDSENSARQDALTNLVSPLSTSEASPTLSPIPNNITKTDDFDLRLHDLCDEATTTDDVAWRNALHLLSKEPSLAFQVEPECQMLPLHVCCLSPTPPPTWIVRALLFLGNNANRQGISATLASHSDSGGRLPLHLIAATSADAEIMQILVKEFPSSISHRDDRGFTPLHLFLKNTDVNCISLEQLRILLGQTVAVSASAQEVEAHILRPLHRRGEHLSMSIDDLTYLRRKQNGPFDSHEKALEGYPNDVKSCWSRLNLWKKSQNPWVPKAKRPRTISPIQVSSDESIFINPASIPTPTGKLMPLHLLLRRGSTQIKSTRMQENAMIEQGFLPTSRGASLSDLLLVMIASHPEALMMRDANGRTPLIAALLMKDSLPKVEVVELLLGVRTPGCHFRGGYKIPPSWAHDLNSLHRDKGNNVGRWANPAMVPTADTHQLPLHIAAEEAVSVYPLLESICDAYPGARLLQDIRGRTPLHLALGNYQRSSLDERTFELLFCNQNLAKVKDHDGMTPLDLVLKHRQRLRPPTTDPGIIFPPKVYQDFFIASIDEPRNQKERMILLAQLRLLPPWLRRQACASRFVKNLLLDQLTSPIQTATILLNGVMLVALIIAFRLTLDDFLANSSEKGTSSAKIAVSYWVTTLGFAIYHLFAQIFYMLSVASIDEVRNLCLRRFWRWVDFLAAILSMAVVGLILWSMKTNHPSILLELTTQLGTIVTALLWLSLIGYLVKWSYGMAVWVGIVEKLIALLIWPALTLVFLIVAFAQVVFTLEPWECIDESGNAIKCSYQADIRTFHLLFLGVPLGNLEEFYDISVGKMLLFTAFTLTIILLLLSVVVTAVTEAMHFDRRQIALECYWEPKLALLVASDHFLCSNTRKADRDKWIVERPSCMQNFSSQLETFWYGLVTRTFHGRRRNYSNRRNERNWHDSTACNSMLFPVRLLAAMIFTPVWILVGFATLGLLWPPQVRRWLFRGGGEQPRKNIISASRLQEAGTVNKLSVIRNEILHMKSMCYEQTNDVQRELFELKNLILLGKTQENSK